MFWGQCKVCLHSGGRVPDNHADGKQTERLVDHGGGVGEVVEASRVVLEDLERFIEALGKNPVVFLAKLCEGFRKRPKKHDDVLRRGMLSWIR